MDPLTTFEERLRTFAIRGDGNVRIDGDLRTGLAVNVEEAGEVVSFGAPPPPPPPGTGACCHDDGVTCTIETQADCEACCPVWTYMGDGTTCEEVDCSVCPFITMLCDSAISSKSKCGELIHADGCRTFSDHCGEFIEYSDIVPCGSRYRVVTYTCCEGPISYQKIWDTDDCTFVESFFDGCASGNFSLQRFEVSDEYTDDQLIADVLAALSFPGTWDGSCLAYNLLTKPITGLADTFTTKKLRYKFSFAAQSFDFTISWTQDGIPFSEPIFAGAIESSTYEVEGPDNDGTTTGDIEDILCTIS